MTDLVALRQGRNNQNGPLDLAEMFDTWSGSWIPCPVMPRRRAGCSAAALPDGRILVIGGYDVRGPGQGLLDSCDVYDPNLRLWMQNECPCLRQGRWGHASAVLRGVVYVVGGTGHQVDVPRQQQVVNGDITLLTALGTTETWSPGDHEWRQCAPLRVPRAGLRSTPLQDRYLLAVGGNVFSPGSQVHFLSTCELYDVELNSWTQLATPLSLPRSTAGVATLIDRSVLIVGGCQAAVAEQASLIDAAELYVIPERLDETETDETCLKAPAPSCSLPSLATGRMGAPAAQLLLPQPGAAYPTSISRCVAVVGGESFGEGRIQQHDMVSVFDVESLSWRQDIVIPPLRVSRTATAVCVGKGHASFKLDDDGGSGNL
eukprot:TRINITY_DN17110_c0_g1_i2.p1 TRINITY_DN17110_c0_g1~~TRINITY_DN17110_c0_g1_i2.p1  ORF type:complete len:374 (-),score=57.56 TRINITY_DN17110_c0_g1_i2:205-1326(-)